MTYKNRLIFLALAMLPAAAAVADNTGFYFGGSVGNSTEHFDASTFGVSADDTGYKVAAGVRPLDVLAGEVDYVNFGRASAGINYADTDGVGVFALAFLPIPVVDVYGRVGVVNWRVDANSPMFSFHRTGSDVAYGVGAGAHWGNLGARLEFERYQVAGATTVQLATVGLTYTVPWSFL
jgi:hypothetical protein